MVKQLPSGVVSLIHHVELNKAGWWDRSLQQIVTAGLWLHGQPLAVEQLLEQLRGILAVRVDQPRLDRAVSHLESAGALVRLPDGRLKLSEAKQAELQSQVADLEGLETEILERFSDVLRAHDLDLDPAEVWNLWCSKFLIPLVHELGARTYEILSGDRIASEHAGLADFLTSFPEPKRDALRAAVIDFFDPSDAALRRFVLANLNAFFLVEAGSMSEDALAGMTQLFKGRPSFTLFLDTNFLFSILGLHDNPSNEAGLAVHDLAREVATKVDVKFYVLPITVDEARNALGRRKDAVTGIVLTPNILRALEGGFLDGITGRYIEAVRSGAAANPSEYFDPFLKHTIAVLRDKDIELYNADLGEYGTRPDVVNDIVKELHLLELELSLNRAAERSRQRGHLLVRER